MGGWDVLDVRGVDAGECGCFGGGGEEEGWRTPQNIESGRNS